MQLNNSLNDLGNAKLLATVTSKSATDITVDNLSAYKYLTFVFYSNEYAECTTIPVEIFKLGYTMRINGHTMSNSTYDASLIADIKYISDKIINGCINTTFDMCCYVYGIK